MFTLIVILLAVAAVSLISLVGILFIGLRKGSLKRILTGLVSLASGALIGGAFIHLIPEAVDEVGSIVFQYVILGILVFFVMEKLLWRHCHEASCPVHVFGYISLIGDGVHNLIDGMVIATSFLLSPALGITTTLIVILHEVPQEIGDFAVLVYAGFEKKKALLYNLLSALAAVAGSLIAYYSTIYLGGGVTHWLIPFAAGGFIYIAGTDLIPELHKKVETGESVVQLVMILLGLGLMWSMKILL